MGGLRTAIREGWLTEFANRFRRTIRPRLFRSGAWAVSFRRHGPSGGDDMRVAIETDPLSSRSGKASRRSAATNSSAGSRTPTRRRRAKSASGEPSRKCRKAQGAQALAAGRAASTGPTRHLVHRSRLVMIDRKRPADRLSGFCEQDYSARMDRALLRHPRESEIRKLNKSAPHWIPASAGMTVG